MDRICGGPSFLITVRPDQDEELDVQRSYYRFCFLPHARHTYTFVSGLFFIILLIMWAVALKQHIISCNEMITIGNVTQQAIECMGPMVVEGTFVSCVMVDFMFFLTVLNMAIHGYKRFDHPLPLLVRMQRTIFHMFLPNTFIAAAVYDWFLKGTRAGTDAYYGVAVTPALFMAIWGVFGTYDMEFRDIFYSYSLLNTYIFFVFIASAMGVYIYPKFNPETDVGHLMGLVVGSVVIHATFIAIHKLIKVRYGRIQLWVRRSAMVDDSSSAVVDGT